MMRSTLLFKYALLCSLWVVLCTIATCSGDQPKSMQLSYLNPQMVYTQSDGSYIRLYYRRSTDGGATFSTSRVIDAATGSVAGNPKLRIDAAENPLVIFTQSDGSYTRLYFTRSFDQGATFTTPVIIDAATGQNVGTVPEIIYAPNDTIHVFFGQNLAGVTRLYHTRSVSGGSFSTPTLIDNGNFAASTTFAITFTLSGKVYVGFLQSDGSNQRAYFTRSLDAGASFSTPIICDNGTANTVTHISIAFDSSENPAVSFDQSDGINGQIYFRKSSNGGASFDTAIRIDNLAASTAFLPRIAISTYGIISIVYPQSTVGINRLYYSRSTDGGSTFSTPTLIDTTSAESVYLSVIQNDLDGNPHIFFIKTSGGVISAFYVKSSDQGASFPTPTQVDAGTGNAWGITFPSIGLSTDGNPFLMFVQISGVRRIFVNRSIDGGQTFLGATRLDEGSTNVGTFFNIAVRPLTN